MIETIVGDVWIEIFLFLEPKEIPNILQTSKKLFSLIENNSFWESFSSLWIKLLASSEQSKILKKIKNPKQRMISLFENREIELKTPIKNNHSIEGYSCVIHKFGFYKNEKEFRIFFHAKDEKSRDDLQKPHCFNFSFEIENGFQPNFFSHQSVFNDSSDVNIELFLDTNNEKHGCYIYPLKGLSKSEYCFQYGFPLFGGYPYVPLFDLNDEFIYSNYLKFILPHLTTRIAPTPDDEEHWLGEIE
jgi:hypothetical protein